MIDDVIIEPITFSFLFNRTTTDTTTVFATLTLHFKIESRVDTVLLIWDQYLFDAQTFRLFFALIPFNLNDCIEVFTRN